MLLGSIIGLYALFLGCGGFIAYHFRALSNRLDQFDNLEANIMDRLDRLNASPDLLSTLKDSVSEVVEDAIENMQPPTAFDHLAGAAVQFMQMKMMAGLEQVSPQLADMAETIIDDNV